MEWEKGLTFALAKRKRGGARAANETESGASKKKTFQKIWRFGNKSLNFALAFKRKAGKKENFEMMR